MFTGLIETIGKVKSVVPKGDVWLIDISAPVISKELKLGDSVSIDGACQTVVRRSADLFSVEMMDETRRCTKLGFFKAGTRVNLERAMRVDSRLDGHIVAGHVDGTASVSSIEDHGRTKKCFFKAASDIIAGIVRKGSVAVDGVSLTVIDVTEDTFSVELIPTTEADTTLAELKIGDKVNIETDLVGKYIMKFVEAKFAEAGHSKKDDLTWKKLAELGW